MGRKARTRYHIRLNGYLSFRYAGLWCILVYEGHQHLYSPAFMDIILTLHLTKEFKKFRLEFVHLLLAVNTRN